MTDIGHGGHRLVGDQHLNALASVQVTLSFIGIKAVEAYWVDIDEENTVDNGAWAWEDERIPEIGFNALEPDKGRLDPRELLPRQGRDALRVHEGPVHKEIDRLLAWHASSSSNTQMSS